MLHSADDKHFLLLAHFTADGVQFNV